MKQRAQKSDIPTNNHTYIFLYSLEVLAERHFHTLKCLEFYDFLRLYPIHTYTFVLFVYIPLYYITYLELSNPKD